MAGKRVPLTPVDSVWFRMDRPVNHVMVTSVVLLGTPVDFQRVKEVFEERLLVFDRFRSRVVEHMLPTPTLYWEPDPHFDIDNHIHHVALPSAGTKQDLLELVSDLATVSIDYDRPLWQVHVVDNVEGGSAVVTRFHHCIADGTAMMAVSSRLLDATPQGAPALPALRKKAKRGGFLDAMFHPRRTLANSTHAVTELMHEGVEVVTHPTETLEKLQLTAEGVGIAALTAVKTPDPTTPLRGHLSGKQRVSFSDPVPLDDVKAIGKAAGATVNDVLVAAMAGALRHYLVEHGANVSGMTIRAVVPMDLRPAEKAFELGNAFGLVFLDLPVNEAEPPKRLRATKRAMDRIKRSPEAAVLLNIMAIMGRTPKQTEDLVSNLFASKATMVLTNVAGPKEQLYMAGAPIENIVFWVPHPVDMSMGVSIFSYKGAVTLGVITDAGAVPNPEVITDRFSVEFEKMKALVHRHALAAPAEATPTAEARPTAQVVTKRCAATTKSGAPCRNKALPGSDYCRVHQPKA